MQPATTTDRKFVFLIADDYRLGSFKRILRDRWGFDDAGASPHIAIEYVPVWNDARKFIRDSPGIDLAWLDFLFDQPQGGELSSLYGEGDPENATKCALHGLLLLLLLEKKHENRGTFRLYTMRKQSLEQGDWDQRILYSLFRDRILDVDIDDRLGGLFESEIPKLLRMRRAQIAVEFQVSYESMRQKAVEIVRDLGNSLPDDIDFFTEAYAAVSESFGRQDEWTAETLFPLEYTLLHAIRQHETAYNFPELLNGLHNFIQDWRRITSIVYHAFHHPEGCLKRHATEHRGDYGRRYRCLSEQVLALSGSFWEDTRDGPVRGERWIPLPQWIGKPEGEQHSEALHLDQWWSDPGHKCPAFAKLATKAGLTVRAENGCWVVNWSGTVRVRFRSKPDNCGWDQERLANLYDWYEIILAHRDGKPRVWKNHEGVEVRKTDSLVAEAEARWSNSSRKRAETLTVLVDLSPKPRLNYCPETGFKYSLFVADDGPGVAGDEERNLIDRGRFHRGGLFAHVLERSKTWCSAARLFTRPDKDAPIRMLELYDVQAGSDAQFSDAGGAIEEIPEPLKAHFAGGGACFQFEFTIQPLKETVFF